MSGLVSLLIPCHNSAAFLPGLLSDAAALRDHWAEVLVYDDGSTDGTADVARRFGAQVIRSETNHGVSHARNKLLGLAIGDFLHFHDADDRIERKFFDILLPAARKNVIAFGDYRVAEPDGCVIREIRYALPSPSITWSEFFLRYHVPLDCTLIPRSVIRPEVKFCEDMRLAEDRLFHVQLASLGLRFEQVPGFVARATRRTESLSRSSRQLDKMSHEAAFLERAAALLSPDSTGAKDEIGRQWLEVALGYWLAGAREQADAALARARGFGVNRFDRGSRSLCLISRWIGPKAALMYAASRIRPPTGLSK